MPKHIIEIVVFYSECGVLTACSPAKLFATSLVCRLEPNPLHSSAVGMGDRVPTAVYIIS